MNGLSTNLNLHNYDINFQITNNDFSFLRTFYCAVDKSLEEDEKYKKKNVFIMLLIFMSYE